MNASVEGWYGPPSRTSSGPPVPWCGDAGPHQFSERLK